MTHLASEIHRSELSLARLITRHRENTSSLVNQRSIRCPRKVRFELTIAGDRNTGLSLRKKSRSLQIGLTSQDTLLRRDTRRRTPKSCSNAAFAHAQRMVI